ncbi:MAG: hypothetical protein ACXVFQ_01535 [Solirubrobacteraceae bacterium]
MRLRRTFLPSTRPKSVTLQRSVGTAGKRPAAPSASTRESSPTPGVQQLLRLQATVGNGVLADMIQTPSMELQRDGLVQQGLEWIKGKFETEKELDKQLEQGLDRTATVFKAAKLAVEAQEVTQASLKQAQSYGELAEKFEKAAGNAGKIIALKENLLLLGEFKAALADAEKVDLSRDGEAGAAKLFKLIAVGGKIGKKVFPPPFDQYFDFLSQMKNLENVARAWKPDRPGGPHSEQWEQLDK